MFLFSFRAVIVSVEAVVGEEAAEEEVVVDVVEEEEVADLVVGLTVDLTDRLILARAGFLSAKARQALAPEPVSKK